MNNGASAYAVAIYVTSALSLLMNAVLLALYARCPLKTVKTYKYFFTATAVHDVAVSTSMLLCVPRAHHGETYLVHVSTGLLHQWQDGGAILVLFWAAISASLLILTNSFIYRYIHICRSELLRLYTSWRWILFIYIVNLLLFANFCFMVATTSLPNEAFKAQIYAELPEIGSNAFAGVSLIHSFNDFSGLLAADFIVVTLSLSGTAFYCAVRIHLTLKRTGLSSNAKRLQRQMFRVLLVQTACPTLLLSFPASATHVSLFGGMETSQPFTDGLGVIVSLYPLVNPLVTMFSISDYRRYLFSLLSISSKSPSGVHASRISTAWMERTAA